MQEEGGKMVVEVVAILRPDQLIYKEDKVKQFDARLEAVLVEKWKYCTPRPLQAFSGKVAKSY